MSQSAIAKIIAGAILMGLLSSMLSCKGHSQDNRSDTIGIDSLSGNQGEIPADSLPKDTVFPSTNTDSTTTPK